MLNIIIADDETIERMILKQTLHEHYGEYINIYEATNGRESVELSSQHSIHIAIMDISMPGINGIEAAGIIIQHHPSCRLIFLTAYEDFQFAKKAISLQAIDYLLKPCSDEELINAVDVAIQSYHDLVLYKQISQSASKKTTFVKQISDSPEKSDSYKIINYIKTNFHKDLSLHDLAQKFGYSDVYFCKFFKNNFNLNFTTYLTNLRIEAAKNLLKDTSINIKNVSLSVGYSDANYFAKVFKRIVHVSPSEYRSKYANQD